MILSLLNHTRPLNVAKLHKVTRLAKTVPSRKASKISSLRHYCQEILLLLGLTSLKESRRHNLNKQLEMKLKKLKELQDSKYLEVGTHKKKQEII